MVEINEVSVNRVLNPTAINLGDYVINPYVGCEFSCLYCYVRSNKVASKRKRPWGTYVDIRKNAPDLLEKEICEKKPKTVLLGSTTECFQPVEKKFQLTKRILEILNNHEVPYIILTRSPYVVEYIPLLNQRFCKRIYFTVNNYSDIFKQAIEPKSPSFVSRNIAIQALLDAGMPVIPYYSPVIPWVTEIKDAFSLFTTAERVDFEYLNFNLKNTQDIIKSISLTDRARGKNISRMFYEKNYYEQTWDTMDEEIERQASRANKRYKRYRHPFDAFFKNTYFD
ncbi:MAG: radical SAM protein [Candidatus Brocadia sp.]|nr:radical SAM protein [Candidatus Brocadia sp.]